LPNSLFFATNGYLRYPKLFNILNSESGVATMAQVITSADQINFSIADRPSMPLPTDVLMVRPLHYSVDYVINPHMADQVGNVDTIEAQN
jgi:hypothetical protein